MSAEAKVQTELHDFKSLFSLEGKVVVVVCCLPLPQIMTLVSGSQDTYWVQKGLV